MTRIGFSAGRYDAKPAAVGAYARDVIDADDLSVLLTTETYNRKLARAIRRRLPAGWVARRRGEYLACWDRKVARAARVPLPRLRRLSWVYRGRDGWRDARLSTRHLIIGGRRVILDVAHLQAGVEWGESWRMKPWPAAGNSHGHQVATTAWGRLVRQRLIRRPFAAQVLFMDANTDQRQSVWRQRLTRSLDLPSVWEGRLPGRGTHGHRLIDTCHTSVPVIAAGVSRVKPPAGMDHTAIWVDLDLRKKAR